MNLYLKCMESAPSFLYGLLCFSAILVWILVAILTLPFMFLFRILKWFQGICISYYRLGKVLACRDVPFLHETEYNRNVINGLFVVEGTVDVQEIRQLIMARVVRNVEEPSYARMRKRIVQRYWRYVWQDEPNFDINKHVRRLESTAGPRNEEELQKMLSETFSSPMPEDLSPWEILLKSLNIPGKDQTAICMRVHHAIGDGFALLGLFARLMDKKPELLRVKKPVATPCDKQKQVWKAILTGPLALLSVALSTADNPFPAKKMSGEKCISWTKTIDLAHVKEIKTRTGTTINDVLSTCLAGSLRRYLKSQGTNNPDDIQIVVTINTRSLKVLSRDNIPLENHSTGLLYNLPVGMADPLKRLLETKRRMDNLKSSADWRIFGFIYSQIVGRLPDFIGRFSSFSINRHCSLILSNLPGPLAPFEISGKEVVTAIAWPPLVSDTGMAIAVFSYAGTMRMSVLSDKAVLADPGKLTEKFIEEFDEMYECVMNCPALLTETSAANKKSF